MRIGVMLRSFDEKGGVGVYTQNLVRELLALDRRNRYVLFYRRAENLGRFAHYENVEEVVVRGLGVALWDQVAIPLACWRKGVDVVLHPKFTVPLLAPCKAVMVVHGADWFMPDQAQFYGWLDVRYIRAVMPLYFRKASVVLSVSELTTQNFNRVMKLPPDKVRTVYFGPARHFRRIEDAETLARVRERYRLPERFVLTLTKLGGDRRKNFGNILEGYRLYHERAPQPLPLVVGGKGVDRFRSEYGIPDRGWGRDVHFPDWLDQQDLPAIYSQADLYLYASNLEAFPIPLTEAMTCGTPIVTSNVNGLDEIAGDAAVQVDPTDPGAIAAAIERVLADPGAQAELRRKGLERSRMFSWEKCARETLAILESVAADGSDPCLSSA